MIFLKQSLILLFLCHKSATTYQTDSNKVSNANMKPMQLKNFLFPGKFEKFDALISTLFQPKFQVTSLGFVRNYNFGCEKQI